ncbi:MAG TPA: hypothetical protein VFN67_27500 [Polyangiales bacterium]|nr:hypothetical protein [Polyangiales bacterium]
MRLISPLDCLRLQRGVSAFCLLATLSGLAGCQLFESTCAEDDRTCLGGGTVRSGKLCVRDGDCARGLNCIDNLCEYVGSTKSGGSCVATAECGAGLYCSLDLVCRAISADPQGKGGVCSTSQECEKGLVCDADVDQLFSEGPFGLLSDICQDAVDRNDTPDSCALPRTCTERGNVDRGGHCESSRDCVAGMYCIPDVIDLRQSVCFGGEKLPVEPISVPLWGGVRCPSDAENPVAYFEVPRSSGEDKDFYRLPFPNDIRRDDNGIDLSGHPSPPDDLTPATAAAYLKESQSLDGFATNPVVFFRFSKPLRSRQGDLSLDTFRIVDITPGSPDYGSKASVAWGPTKRRSNYVCPNWIGIHRPLGAPLRPGTTYAALVTKGVRTEAGEAYATSPDFEAMLGDSRPSDIKLASAWERYAPLRAYLDDKSDIPKSELLNAAVFTTQAATDVVQQLRAAVEADGVPKLQDLTVCKAGVRSPCEDDTGRGKCHEENKAFTEIHGRVSLPIFQRGSAPYETPQDGGDIAQNEAGKAEIQKHANVCLGISVPKLPAPEGGYPVLLVAHPTGGSFSDQLGSSGLASWAATIDTPSVLLSIDLPVHGDRRGASKRPPQDLFFNLVNPKSARGNALQGAADLMALARVAADGISADDSPLDGPIAFDPKRVAMFAHSQGATHAALMIGGEPRVRSVVLAGLAGQITAQLLSLKRPTDTSSILPFLLFDPDTRGKLVGVEAQGGGHANPMLALMQGYLDSSDPINYAAQLQLEPPSTAPNGHDVLFVYGLFDSFTPEPVQKAYADAAGLSAVDPDLTLAFNEVPSPARGNVMIGNASRTVGLRTYDPKGDAINPELVQDGHLVSSTTRRGSADVRRFLGQALGGQTPQIGQ